MIVNKKRPSTSSDVANANGQVVSGSTDNCAGHWWYIAGEGAGIGAGDATSSSLRSDFRIDKWMTSSAWLRSRSRRLQVMLASLTSDA